MATDLPSRWGEQRVRRGLVDDGHHFGSRLVHPGQHLEHARCDRSGRLARSGLRRVVDLMLASALLPNTERGHGSVRFVGSVTSSSWDVHFYPRAGIAVGVLFSVDCLTLIWPSHRSPKVLQVVPGPLGQHDSSALG